MVLRMDSGSFTSSRSGRDTLLKVRIDCCGRYRSGAGPSGTNCRLATCSAKSGSTTSSHCHRCTGSQTYAVGSRPCAVRTAVNRCRTSSSSSRRRSVSWSRPGTPWWVARSDPGGQPVQYVGPAGLRRVRVPVGAGEAHPTLVREDPRVPGLVSLQLDVGELGQLGGRPPGGEQVRVGGERRGQLPHRQRGDRRVQPPRLVQIEQQPVRVRRLAPGSDSGRRLGSDSGRRLGSDSGRRLGVDPDQSRRVDPPGVHRHRPGPELVPESRRQLDPVAIAAERLRPQRLLEGEFGDHLGAQRGAGAAPQLRRQLGRCEQRGRRLGRDGG